MGKTAAKQKKKQKQKNCPCGSSRLLADCCAPIIADHSKAETAQQLMRSRYTAFTLAEYDYLIRSWAKATRPEKIMDEDDSIQWLGLEIQECEHGGSRDNEGHVTFTASFISSGQLCKLHEKSSFIKEAGLWYYLDGETESSTEEIGRSAPCPCGSGKKFKRCCCC